MQPSDYTVSLEMAQRPELHAAMRKAGCWAARLEWEKLPDEPGWAIAYSSSADLTQLPAWSYNELICAAVALANELEDTDYALSIIGLSIMPGERTQAHGTNEDDMTLFLTESAHGPDALAELVIALAAEVTP